MGIFSLEAFFVAGNSKKVDETKAAIRIEKYEASNITISNMVILKTNMMQRLTLIIVTPIKYILANPLSDR
jgi:hypothetical protein